MKPCHRNSAALSQRKILTISICLMLLFSIVVFELPGTEAKTVEDDEFVGPIQEVVPSGTVALNTLTSREREAVIVPGNLVPDLIGTDVNNTDTLLPENDVLVYTWSDATQDWSQIPFQVDERSDANMSFRWGADGQLTGRDEIIFMSGDLGDRASVNEWVVGCDGPRYELEITDPLHPGESGWAYVFTSKNDSVEANNVGDYVVWNFTENNITTPSYCAGFAENEDGNKTPILDYFNVTDAYGGDGQDLLDKLQIELYGDLFIPSIPIIFPGGLDESFRFTEDMIINTTGGSNSSGSGIEFDIDFTYSYFEKDGPIRAFSFTSLEASMDFLIFVNFRLQVNLSNYYYAYNSNITGDLALQLNLLLGLGSLDIHNLNLSLDHTNLATPMNYFDSHGNTATVDGNWTDENIAVTDDNTEWWELNSPTHGGYFCTWNATDFDDDVSTMEVLYEDDYTDPDHNYSEPGHYGNSGIRMSDINEPTWADPLDGSFYLELHPLNKSANNVGAEYYNMVQNKLVVTPTLQQSPAIWVNKTVNVQNATCGGNLFYTIYFNNTGDMPADFVWINDSLPSEVTYVSDTSALEGGVMTGLYNWTFTNVAPGVHYFNITVLVNSGLPDGTVVTNWVYLAFSNQNSLSMIPRTSDSATFIVLTPIISVEKTVDQTLVFPGYNITYTIYFNNTGNGTASAVYINDVLPAWLIYRNDSNATEGGVLTSNYNWTFDNVGPGVHSFTINVTVDPALDFDFWLDNVVELWYLDYANNVIDSSTENALTFVLTIPEFLSFVKVVNVSQATTGETVQYIIYFNNTGNGSAATVWVNDTLPAGVTYLSDSSGTEGGSKVGDYRWIFNDVKVGPHSFVINVSVNAGIPDWTVLNNMVEMAFDHGNGTVEQLGPANAAFTVVRPVIQISKTVNQSACVAGQAIQYIIYFNNTGSWPATFVWVNDTIPAGVTYASDSSALEGGVKTGDFNWTFFNVASGPHSFAVNVTMNGGNPDGAVLVNTADLNYSSPGGVTESGGSDDALLTVLAPDITLGKWTNNTTPHPNEMIHYILSINNTGHDYAQFVWVNDTLPDNVTYFSNNASSLPGFAGSWNVGPTWYFNFTNIGPGSHKFIMNITINNGVLSGTRVNNTAIMNYTDRTGAYMEGKDAYFDGVVVWDPDYIEAIVQPDTVHANGTDSTTIIAWVNDTFGTSIMGEPVSFNIVAPGSGTLIGPVIDLMDGRYSIIYQAGWTLGNVTVRAFSHVCKSQNESFVTTALINDPPVADAYSNATTVLTYEEISFDASGSFDPDDAITDYDWDFDDGTVRSGETAQHEYTDDGTYTVTLTVTDNHGFTDSDTITIIVLNRRPIAAFTHDGPADTLVDVNFNAAGSSDLDGTIASYSWNFGDYSTGTGVSPSHSYDDDGVYTVTLTITDDDGSTGAITADVTINNQAPVADAGSDMTGRVGEAISFDATGSSDAESNMLAYSWDFGDGSNGAAGATMHHVFHLEGVYTVTLTVTDDDGETDTDTLSVTILGYASMGVSLALSPTTVDVGNTSTITVTYESTGEETATSVYLNLSLPGQCQFVSSDLTPTGTLSWYFAELAPGTYSFTVVVQVTDEAASPLSIGLSCEYLDRDGTAMQASDSTMLNVNASASTTDDAIPILEYWWILLILLIIIIGYIAYRMTRKKEVAPPPPPPPPPADEFDFAAAREMLREHAAEIGLFDNPYTKRAPPRF